MWRSTGRKRLILGLAEGRPLSSQKTIGKSDRLLAEVANDRQYLQGLLESAQAIESGQRDDDFTRVVVPDHYRCIYDAHAGRLGCLSRDETRQVVRFYQLADAVIRDVSPGGALYELTDDASAFQEAADILAKALSIAEELDAKDSAKITNKLRAFLCQRCR